MHLVCFSNCNCFNFDDPKFVCKDRAVLLRKGARGGLSSETRRGPQLDFFGYDESSFKYAAQSHLTFPWSTFDRRNFAAVAGRLMKLELDISLAAHES